jgi:hypothetical protein
MTEVAFAIQAQNLIKWYGRTQALRGVNLEVHRGEIFGLLAWWRFERRDVRVAGEGNWGFVGSLLKNKDTIGKE